ncbi:ankyrin repeat-containing protein [Penaeus vannamei]|uniref:Ankyrin repeat-containing protein n=1 Tax=Penaeus vannamei TaxID=6689 RepID=A0A423TGX3_PENVA|nr:ankyrin repeat-containing protein [Penaeus vannamei]
MGSGLSAETRNLISLSQAGDVEGLQEALESLPEDSLKPLLGKVTVLSYCMSMSGYEAIVRLLLEKGAKVNAKNKDGDRPLHSAVRGGSEAVVKTLLRKDGIKIDAADGAGRTPLHLAAEKGHNRIIQMLLKNGANVNAMRNDGWSALHEAAYNGHWTTLQQLRDQGGKVGGLSKTNDTPLHLAASQSHPLAVFTLLASGASTCQRNTDGKTPLNVERTNTFPGQYDKILSQCVSLTEATQNWQAAEEEKLKLQREKEHLQKEQEQKDLEAIKRNTEVINLQNETLALRRDLGEKEKHIRSQQDEHHRKVQEITGNYERMKTEAAESQAMNKNLEEMLMTKDEEIRSLQVRAG